jgi:hypothetical protein
LPLETTATAGSPRDLKPEPPAPELAFSMLSFPIRQATAVRRLDQHNAGPLLEAI